LAISKQNTNWEIPKLGNSEAKRTGFILKLGNIEDIKKIEETNFVSMNFRFFTKAKKRKGSIEIYRSFVIPNLSNEMTLWWGEGLSHSMI
jgi:hypothetical protein